MAEVRHVTAADVPDVAAVLGRAFEDDPVWSWIFPDAPTRVDRLTAVFGLMVRYVHLRHEGTEVAGRTAGVLEAGALWDPPGAWRLPIGVQIRQAPKLIRAFGGRLPAALRALGAIEREHPREPHWYLAVLGTDPAAQGHGLGGALLRSRLDRCDAAGVPAYLESSKPENVPYYKKFGFQVTKELAMPGGAPPVWLMWRAPA